jgi:hypothetical protein
MFNPLGVGQDGRLIDYIEGVIRHAITDWKVRYFKFDFLVWVDCAGGVGVSPTADSPNPVSAYEYQEAFVDMLDRLTTDHPRVTFQIDETNDYRLFPFESVAYGPSWYANGGPTANEALHNLWVLAPYVPGSTLGQATLAGDRDTHSAGYLMAVALGSHLTFFTDLTRLSDGQVADARVCTDLYKAHRERFAGFAYPLLDDPIGGDTWTALQPWDADAQCGALLVYRQDAPEDTRTVALRGVRGQGRYRVTDARTGDIVGEYDADELRAGIRLTLPGRFSAAVLLVDPVL